MSSTQIPAVAPPGPVVAAAAHAPRMRAGNLVLRLVSALALLCAVAFPVVVLWGRNRGLDLTDESFYLLGLRPSQERAEIISDWQEIMVHLTGGRELSVATWRTLNLCLLMASAALLAHGVRRFLVSIGAAGELTMPRHRMLALSTVGTLGYYCYLPSSLSYNSLTSVVLYGCIALVLLMLADGWPATGRGRAGRLLLSAGCGLLLALQFWVKAPPLAALVCLIGATLLVYPPDGRRGGALAAHVVAIGLGGAAGAALYFTLVRGPSEYVRLLSAQMEALTSSSHNPLSLLKLYVQNLHEFALLVLRCLPTVLGAAAVGWMSTTEPRWLRAPAARLAVVTGIALAAFWMLWVLRQAQMLDFSATLFQRAPAYLALLVVVAAAWLGARIGAHRRERGKTGSQFALPIELLVILLLTALPFAAAAGSNNSLISQASFYPAGWVLACILLCEQLAMRSRVRPFAFGIVGVMLLVVSGEFVQGTVVRPYRSTHPRYEETEHPLAATEEVGDIRLAPELRAFVDSVAVLLNASGFRKGDQIVSLYNSPGLVYLLGGRSPGTAWYFTDPDSQHRNCYFLTRSIAPDRPTFFLLDAPPLYAETERCLAPVGVDFAKLQLIGVVPAPVSTPRGTMKIYRAP